MKSLVEMIDERLKQAVGYNSRAHARVNELREEVLKLAVKCGSICSFRDSFEYCMPLNEWKNELVFVCYVKGERAYIDFNCYPKDSETYAITFETIEDVLRRITQKVSDKLIQKGRWRL
jgi:hypothetical protein